MNALLWITTVATSIGGVADDQTELTRRLVNATVYIKTESKTEIGYGSGVIINSLPRRGTKLFDIYIQTASHVIEGQDKIVITTCVDGVEAAYEALVLQATKHGPRDPDLALLQIQTPVAYTPTILAPRDKKIEIGTKVVQIGFPNGKKPAKTLGSKLTITGVDRYLGAANLEATAEPEEGRSGGGLFLEKTGELVGILSVREPQEHRGIYTAISEVYKYIENTDQKFLVIQPNPNFLVHDFFGPAAKKATLTDMSGNVFSLDSLRGKVLFINFWATWCPHCVGELSSIQRLYEKLSPEREQNKIAFLLISDESRAELMLFLKNHGIAIPSYTADGNSEKIAPRLELLPTTCIIYPDGKTIYYYTGSATWDTDEMVTWLKEILP